MISPMKESDRIVNEFVVADIENRSDGSVIAIDTYDGENHNVSRNWQEWLDFIGRKANGSKSYRRIYAHNGGGWDWLSLIEFIIKHDREKVFTTIENGNRIISVSIRISDRTTIVLLDSLYLLSCSLDVAAQKYLGVGKTKLEHLPEWYYDNDRERFWTYLYSDTDLLYRIICKFADLVFRKIARINRLGVTLPSTSLRCYQTGYLSKEITTPSDKRLKELLRSGYTGGRVEVFKSGHFKGINVYDYNSLYPSVMRDCMVPTTGNVRFTDRVHFGKCGIYKIRFRQRNRRLLPLLMSNGVGVYEGEGVYYTPELQRFADKADGQITVIEGAYFTKEDCIFKDYVETLYSLRMTDKDGPLGNTCKLLMNSLYGKFGQQPERSKTVFCTPDEVRAYVKSGATVDILSPEYGVYKITEQKRISFEHVGIAGTITSEARARLWEAFDENTVYCDTDSIHTTTTRETGTGLGQLKLEFSGEGVYVGKKLYALRNEEKEKIRAKGIRVGGELGCDLSFDGLKTLLKGATIECRFKSANTAKGVLKGSKSCTFVERKRTIRKTANV